MNATSATKLSGRLTAITNAEEAGAAIASTDTTIHNYRNGAADREKLAEVIAKLPAEARKLVEKNLVAPTDSSIDAVRVNTIETAHGIIGGICKHLWSIIPSKEVMLTMDDVTASDILRKVTTLYNSHPQAFPLKVKNN